MEDSFSVCHTFLWARDLSALLQACEFLHGTLNMLSAEKTQHGNVTVKPVKDPFYAIMTLVIWSWSNTKYFSFVVNDYVFDAVM